MLTFSEPKNTQIERARDQMTDHIFNTINARSLFLIYESSQAHFVRRMQSFIFIVLHVFRVFFYCHFICALLSLQFGPLEKSPQNEIHTTEFIQLNVNVFELGETKRNRINKNNRLSISSLTLYST